MSAHPDSRPPRPWWAQPRWQLAATAGVMAVLLGLCVRPDPAVTPAAVSTPAPTPTPTPTATPTPTPTPVGPPAPLTGIPTEDASLINRRVLAVKIDNHDNARPQTGLNLADGVMELPVESGLTRFIALFHTTDIDHVGPVRSGRPTDPTLVRPLGATLLISGAQPWIVNVIRNAGVPLFVDIGEGITFRSPDRVAPHNLYADTTALRAAADAREIADDPPPAWFVRAEPTSPAAGRTVQHVRLPFSDETVVVWELVDGQWLRTHNGAAHFTLDADGAKERIAVDHLVVITATRYTARNPVDGGGLPALTTTGSGKAWVVTGGEDPRVVEATWSRDKISDLVVLRDADGDEVTIPPGRLWVSWMSSARTPTFEDPSASSRTTTSPSE